MKFAELESRDLRLERVISSDAAIRYGGEDLISNPSRRRYLGIAHEQLIGSNYALGNRKIEAIAKKSGGVPRRQNQEAITRSIKSSSKRPGGVFAFTVVFKTSTSTKTWSGNISGADNWIDTAAMVLRLVETQIGASVLSLDIT